MGMRRLETGAGTGAGIHPGREVPMPRETWTAAWDLPAGPTAAAAARELTRAALRGWTVGEAADIDDVVLMVDELVTNAVVHGAGPVRLQLRRTGVSLVGEVSDAGPALPAAPPDQQAHAESGRGLWLVAMLSADHGVRPEPYGKTVWFRRPIASWIP
jgi:anti-sigma regulatory factor (Ser/Thr protein kinase)